MSLFLEAYKIFRDVMEVKDLEYKAWAHVQTLKSSLDEHNLELRVKTANEAEAISQQMLAAAEAEIAELRQKLEASKRFVLVWQGKAFCLTCFYYWTFFLDFFKRFFNSNIFYENHCMHVLSISLGMQKAALKKILTVDNSIY